MSYFAKMRPETIIMIFFPISRHTPYYLRSELSTQKKAQTNSVTLLSPSKTSQWTNPSHAQRAVSPDTDSTGWKLADEILGHKDLTPLSDRQPLR